MQCQNCQQQFTIRPEDKDFYQKIGVPEPHFCPDCRQQNRLAWRNERILYWNVATRAICGTASVCVIKLIIIIKAAVKTNLRPPTPRRGKS